MNLSITGKKYSAIQNDKKITSSQTKPKQKVNQMQLGSKIQPKQILNPKKNQTKPKVQFKKQTIKKQQKQIVSTLKSVKEAKQVKLSNPSKQQKNIQEIKQVQKIVVEPPRITETIVRYNHYKDPFQVENQILRFSTVEQKYGFNLVFKGNYIPILKIYRQPDQIEPLTEGSAQCYSWKVQQGKQYQVFIKQDQQEQSKYQKKAYKAPQTLKKCSCKKNVRVEMLTAQMKNLQLQELGSQKHKELLEQRNLEEILFS